MFKYVKNLYGFSATPEVVDIKVGTSDNISEGALGSAFEGEYNFFTVEKSHSVYVSAEAKPAEDRRNYIKAIRVLPGMIFEVELEGYNEEEPLAIGQIISTGMDSRGNHSFVTPEPGSFIEVISTASYESTGKILVTIIL